jgi:hypothetical protein
MVINIYKIMFKKFQITMSNGNGVVKQMGDVKNC